MWGMAVRFSANIAMLSAMLLVGACAMPDAESFRTPDAATLFRQTSVTNYKDRVLPPVSAADLADPSGSCAGAGEPGVPPVPAAIALEMTECDVVKRAGVAEKTEIGTNDRRERIATLSYFRGERPGIYTFIDGRLKSMELAPEVPGSQKTAKKPAKPAKRAQPNRVSVQ